MQPSCGRRTSPDRRSTRAEPSALLDAGRVPRRDLLKLVAFGVVALVAGVLALVHGLSADRPVFGFLGAFLLGCVVLFLVAVVRTRYRQRDMTPAEREGEYVRRLEEARARRPAWRDSTWWAGVMVLFAAFWAWNAVRAARGEVWWLVAADGLLCLATLGAAVGVLRRRRASSDS